jgi:hypothetical protein
MIGGRVVPHEQTQRTSPHNETRKNINDRLNIRYPLTNLPPDVMSILVKILRLIKEILYLSCRN